MEVSLNRQEKVDKIVKSLKEGPQVLFLRHAFSEYNHSSLQLKSRNGKNWVLGFSLQVSNLVWHIAIAETAELRANRINPSLRDWKLSELGLQQCKDLQEVANQLDVHTVYVSPMQRALLTAYHVFKDHPHFDSIRFIVWPPLREMLSSVWDVPGETKKLMAKFSRKLPNFDTSLMNSFKGKEVSSGDATSDQKESTMSMIDLVYNELYGKN